MNGKKILATLIVLSMVLSAMVVLNKLNINIVKQASATTPGIDDFGSATTDLTYMENGNDGVLIKINTTGLVANTDYFLYKPSYNNTGTGDRNAWLTEWIDQTETTLGQAAKIHTGATTLNEEVSMNGKVVLDRAGLWILDDDGDINGSDASTWGTFFWVNTSTDYSIASISNFDYGTEGTQTITVTEDGNAPGKIFIDLVDPEGNTVFHVYTANGIYTFDMKHNITMAGDYTVRAYKDLDIFPKEYFYYDELDTHYSTLWNPDAGYKGYHDTYGSFFSSDLNDSLALPPAWTYSVAGPWDPPEKNATLETFTVDTAKPIMTLTNTTSVYWGFETRIDVNVTGSDHTGLNYSAENIRMRNTSSGAIYYTGSGIGGAHDFTYIDITNTNNGNYSIYLLRIDPGVNNYDWNIIDNKTWYVYFSYDGNGDGIEEWNSTATPQNKLTVKHTTPPVQLIVNDPLDKKIDIPGYTADSGDVPYTTVTFSIFGTSISDEEGRAYYGDDTGEDWRNITVSGDILYPIDGDAAHSAFNALYHTGTKGDWILHVTPTTPGGTIVITIDWPGSDNGSASKTIDIINGTNVVPSVESFAIGNEITLSITVTDNSEEHLPVRYATVYVFFNGETPDLNTTTGDGKVGNGKNGQYSFILTTDDQGTTAPKNITFAVEEPGSGFWGITRVTMEKDHTMMVNATPTSAYAGDSVLYDISVRLVAGGTPDEDSHGGLNVKIYDENGDYVGDNTDIVGGDAWPITKDATVTDMEIILAGGTYTLYAYNDTHDSQGHNATITVTKYHVASNPAVLAWLIDTETNITFEITPHQNGTLTLNNMSSSPNCSDAGSSSTVDIEDGFGTLEGVNATTLGNVTYDFTPNGGELRAADGLLRITTATATPNPATIYIGEPTTVTITVTHPATGVPLKDVLVGLDHGLNLSTTILAKLPDDAHTDANGQVSFSITAEASGDITIYIENGTDPDNAFTITAAARKAMTISTDPSVNEGQTFIVTAKSNGVVITGVTITFSFNGDTQTTTTGTITLSAPTVQTSLDYPIEASAPGYTSASTSIKVLNVPTLLITLSGSKTSDGKYISPMTVTVSDDSGSLITGATVTFSGTTYTTVNGQVTVTVTKETSGTVTATFTGFESATTASVTVTTGGIPGFELITLIAALGVAFILLRRRQK